MAKDSKKNVWHCMKVHNSRRVYFSLIAFFVITVLPSVIYGAGDVAVMDYGRQSGGNFNINTKVKLQRLFKKFAGSAEILSTKRNMQKAGLDDAPEITGEDLVKAFAPQNTLRWYYYIADYSDLSNSTVQMDVGGTSYFSPQHWIMPDVQLGDADRAKGIPIYQAPYIDYFSDATHCKKYSYTDPIESFYEYYQISDSMVVIQGIVDSIDNSVYVDSLDFLITPLPLNLDTEFIVYETIYYYDNTSSELIQNIIPQGYGTLTTPQGDIEVLKLFNDYTIQDFDSTGTLIDEWNIRFYEFISKEGHMLTVALKDGAPLTGMTEIEYIEYLRIDYATDINDNNEILPQQYVLKQNYPNPFNPSTKISYSVPIDSKVKLDVFDILGKKVATLVDEFNSAGNYTVDFNGANLASGTYIYSLSVDGNIISKAMLLVK